MPEEVSRGAYRIVQEALTNVSRHADPRSAEIALAIGDVGVDIRVESAYRPDRQAPGGAGHGVVGMRERPAIAGGTIDVGPVGAGRWAVRASLPFAR